MIVVTQTAGAVSKTTACSRWAETGCSCFVGALLCSFRSRLFAVYWSGSVSLKRCLWYQIVHLAKGYRSDGFSPSGWGASVGLAVSSGAWNGDEKRFQTALDQSDRVLAPTTGLSAIWLALGAQLSGSESLEASV
ncbi:MAG: hypothetical protein RBJ76_04935 [Stenomitos frigidus ULC029]